MPWAPEMLPADAIVHDNGLTTNGGTVRCLDLAGIGDFRGAARKDGKAADARDLDQAGVAGEFGGAAFDGECVGRDDARGDAIADVVDGGDAVDGLDGDAASTRCFNPAGVGYGGVGCRVDGKTVRTICLNQTAGQIVDVEGARIGLDRESIVDVRNNRAGVLIVPLPKTSTAPTASVPVTKID